MENTLKDQIINAVNEFMAEHNMKPAEFARRAGVNESYFNYAYRGKYLYQNTELKDSFFRKLAVAAGFKTQNNALKHINTNQYVEIISKIDEAHHNNYLNTIIGKTGCGKSYSVERYASLNPLDTIVVTINSTDDSQSIMQEIADKLSIELPFHRSRRLRRLVDQIIKLTQEGRKPVIILDEAENTKLTGLRVYKALYDLLVATEYCGLALIATPELLNTLDKAIAKGAHGMSQLKRRILAGLTILEEVKTNDFDEFFDQANITDVALRQLLKRQCENYGVLHDYVARAIRIADEESSPLTKELFCEIYNITDIS